jgi:hypothetical protein
MGCQAKFATSGTPKGSGETLITNLPDGVAAAALAAAVGASGAVGGLETHHIFDHDEQAAIVKHADTARNADKPPTA